MNWFELQDKYDTNLKDYFSEILDFISIVLTEKTIPIIDEENVHLKHYFLGTYFYMNLFRGATSDATVNNQKAEAYFIKALDGTGEYKKDLYYDLFEITEDMKYLDLAVENYSEDAIFYIVDRYQESKDFLNIVKVLKRGLCIKSPEIAIMLGDYYKNELNDIKKMHKYYSMALEFLTVKHFDTVVLFGGYIPKYLGKTYKKLGQYRRMENAFQTGIKFGCSESMYMLARYYCEIKKYEEAKKLLIMSNEKRSWKGREELGNYYRDVEKDFDKMKKCYDEGIIDHDWKCAVGFGKFYEKNRQYKKAIIFYKERMEKGMIFYKLQFQLGRMYHFTHQYKKAWEIFDSSKTMNYDILNALGHTNIRLGKKELGMKQIEESCNEEYGCVKAMNFMAFTHRNDIKKCVKYLKMAANHGEIKMIKQLFPDGLELLRFINKYDVCSKSQIKELKKYTNT
jgi:hypothetical protein